MDIQQIIAQKGYVDVPVNKNIDLVSEIKRLKQQKNAVILAHYYTEPEVQDIADFVGDSLELSKKAANTDAEIILFAGVHFMAETAKILSPTKKVLIPDKRSGCPLADSLTANKLQQLKKQYPEHVVVVYVNTTAEVKAMSDITCTSSNAVAIVDSLPDDAQIIFGPDRNLGTYVKGLTGRDMVIWDGFCPVHQAFSLKKLEELKQKYPDAKLVVHPESDKKLVLKADFIGSTSQIINFVKTSDAQHIIVATEPGIIHKMQQVAPDKVYIPMPTDEADESICKDMKKNDLRKIYLALKYEAPEVVLSEEIIEKAYKPIWRMLEISKQLKLI